MPLPLFTPADPQRLREAFDHEDFIFELKMDGFRSLAYVDRDETRLVSRKGHTYEGFADLCAAIHLNLDCGAVLDGEIVCLDSSGRPQFYSLLRHRGEPVFYVFDILWQEGRDLRSRPLIERKRILRHIVPDQPSAMLYAQHFEKTGRDFYRLVCQEDLEGVVAKLKYGAYGVGWFKIRNPVYSQYEGRRDLFEKRRTLAVQ